MGIFSHRRPAPAPGPNAWMPDGTGVVDGGDCGGDIQDGQSYSVRFTNPALPGSLITVTFIPVNYGYLNDGDESDDPPEWAVQRQVEWMVCGDPRDPGGTEIWSDVAYDDVNYLAIGSQREAEKEARAFARDELERAWTYSWDGQPTTHTRDGRLKNYAAFPARDPCRRCTCHSRIGVSTPVGGTWKCAWCGALETWDGQPYDTTEGQ